jgi:predicted unusual protein kinase regulating ubiquinone biosynthesis (AarF/ABC1/UbiB family)
MASYLDEGLPEPVRDALASLQAGAPPMSGELAAECIERDLGARPEDLFLEWDPVPLAAASIGQVHRALCVDPADGVEKAVAVKVQYPGVDEAITADLANADLFGNVLRMLFRGLDPEPLVEEIRERVVEELDYLREAENQRLFATFYAGHPFIHVPPVIDAFSGRRVLTTELATGARFDELLTWPQEEKDLAAEAIYRFVFRSLYRFQAFNGDPHPGNYLFERGGRVTFLDFGLVKRFTDAELAVFEQMIDAAVLNPDPGRFRSVVEEVGLLRRGAPVSTDETSRYFEAFYAIVRDRTPNTITPAYASDLVRRVFDTDSPIAQHASLPRSFVIIQRINLGLYSILARLCATRSWRSIAEELWPMTSAPPSTPMGEAEAAWLRSR